MINANKKVGLKIFIISFIIVSILGMLVSFIINDPISFTDSISNNKKIDIHIDNISATTSGNATYTLPLVNKTSLVNYNVTFNDANSFIEYTFTITNKGGKDATLSQISIASPICSGSSSSDNKIFCDNLKYKLLYKNGNKIKIEDKLKKKATQDMKLIIEVPDSLNTLVTFPIKVNNIDINFIYI